MLKQIIYKTKTETLTAVNQYDSENNATTLTIDFSNCYVDNWVKKVDYVVNGVGSVLELGTDIVVSADLSSSNVLQGRVEIQPYAVNQENGYIVKFDVKTIVVNRSLNL